MKSKNILLAGIAAGALAAAASGASALSLSGTTVAGIQVTSGSPSSPTLLPYLLANEAKVPVGGLTGAVSLDAHLTTGTISSGTFLVTYTISGASFNTTGITGASLTYIGVSGSPATAATVSTANATSVTFVVTIGTNASISDFVYATPITMATPGAVSVTEAVTLPGNATVVDNGSTTGTIINTTYAFSAIIGSPTASSDKATINTNFTQFATSSGCVSPCGTSQLTWTVGSVMATANSSAFRDLSGSTRVTNSDVTAITVTFPSSTLGTSETITVGPSTSVAGSTAVAAVVTPAGSSQSITLTQNNSNTATAGQLAVSGYNATVVDSVNSTLYNQASVQTAVVTEGAITYEGVILNAAWVGDGTSGYNFQIRIGNLSSFPVAQVSAVLKNPLNVTATSGSTCTIAASIAAGAELVINSAKLQTCFGNFGRSDAIIVVQAASTAISAKMRVVGPGSNVATEQSLGFGTTVATQP